MRHKSDLPAAPETAPDAGDGLICDLAQFRYALRQFLRFSENAAREHGVTPQQHQLMLGVAGFTGRGSATVSELAEFLQERPHSVLGLIDRAVQNGLVHRVDDKNDRRVTNIVLTSRGRNVLARLSRLHHQEARRFRVFLSEQRGRKASASGEHRAAGGRKPSEAAQSASVA